jgi:hypothetical protein
MPTTAVKELIKANMTCKTKDLLETLKFLKGVVPKNKMGSKYNCEITFKTNQIDFVIIGASKTLYCNANGPAKISIPVLYLYDIVKTIKEYSTEVSAGYGFVEINHLRVYTWTNFLEDDTVLRSVNLPINFTPADIVKLPEKHTNEELDFNNLTTIYYKTFRTLSTDIKSVHEKLKKYGFTLEEINLIIKSKIYKNQNSKTENYEKVN